MPQPRIAPQTIVDIDNILHQYGEALKESALESEGFLYVPAENITIIPPAEKRLHGILEIREPREKIGTEHFDLRDKFEQAWPVGEVAPAAEWENSVFDGKLNPPSFHPEVGGRICLTHIQTYETAEGVFVLIPIHPQTESAYQLTPKRSGQAKLSGTNMLRGQRFPSAQELFKAAQSKVTHNLQDLQDQNPGEKIASQPQTLPAGLWDIRLVNQKGKYSEIKNCHVHRDPSTGTLDLFSIQKQYLFDEFENFHPQENLSGGLERVTALVPLDCLKSTSKDASLELPLLYFSGKQIKDLPDLPENYRALFKKTGDGIFLKNFQPTPPLEAFLALESRIIQKTPKDLTGEIRQKIGGLFENLVATALEREKNSQQLKIEVPPKEHLQTFLSGQPEEFRLWALGLRDRTITIQPDFILEDGTFIETKSGDKLDLKPEKRQQIYRMILYKLLKNAELKIRIISLEGPTAQDPAFAFLQYENFFETELAEKITERDLKPIKVWQSFLPK